MAYARLLRQFKQEGSLSSNPAPKGLSRQAGANKGQVDTKVQCSRKEHKH